MRQKQSDRTKKKIKSVPAKRSQFLKKSTDAGGEGGTAGQWGGGATHGTEERAKLVESGASHLSGR